MHEYKEESEKNPIGFNHFVARIFFWVFAGLLLTSIVAKIIMDYPELVKPLLNEDLFFQVFIAQLIFVSYISQRVMDLPIIAVVILFVVYSTVNGYIFAIFLSVYTQADAILSLFITSIVFAVMTAYGLFSTREITGTKSFVQILSTGFFISLFAKFVMNSDVAEFTSYLAVVLIFSSLTAYDFKLVKNNFYNTEDSSVQARLALGTAFSLYLNLINIFFVIMKLIYLVMVRPND